MEQSEVEKLIGELETGLDRLRSLYEQYFVGIERIEPGVARKDVERRLYVLRKEQIRNTALRYRFQMVLQKFNTYQTHWLRICREIENGTYKRHLLRAQRRFGSSRPRRQTSMPPPPEVHPEPGAALPKDLAAQLAELDQDFAPASFEVEVQLDDDGPSPHGPRSPAPSVNERAPPAAPLAPPAPAPARPGGFAGQPVWKKAVAPGAAPPQPAAAPPTRVPYPSPVPRPRSVPPAPAQRSPQPAPAPPARAPHPAPAPPVRAPAPAPAPPLRPPQAVASVAHRPPPVGQPVPRAAQPVAPPALPPRPDPPRPSPATPAPPRSPSLVAPRPAASSSELSEKRLRQIYVEYVDAKRRQHESTAAITYQSVAKSLRESGDKLRQKHGKAVDFEVAVKDGKTILRPVLK